MEQSLFGLNAPMPQSPASQVFNSVSRSVFVVEAMSQKSEVSGSGSGVSVAAGLVVTNCHVIEESAAIRVRRDKITWPSHVAVDDSEHDICLLKVDGLSAPALPIRASSTLKVGERVYAIGAPEGLELTISEEIVSSLREFEGSKLIQTTAPISPGSSGGGLFDSEGQLVGITSFAVERGQNLNFALPGEWVNKSLEVSMANVLSKFRPRQDRYQQLDALLWLEAAFDAEANGEYEKAIGAATEAYKTYPKESLVVLGYVYNEQEQYVKAVGAYEELVKLEPNNGTDWSALGDGYFRTSRDEEAIEAYRIAGHLVPGSPDVPIRLSNVYARKSAMSKDVPAEAERFAKEAVAECREAVRLRPDYVPAHVCLAKSLQTLGINSAETVAKTLRIEMMDECRKAVTLEANSSSAHECLGEALLQDDNYSGAEQEFREAIRLNANDSYAYAYMGLALGALGNNTAAAEQFDQAAHLSKELHGYFSIAATLLTQAGDIEGAVKECKEWLRLESAAVRAHDCLGEALYAMHDLAGAHTEFREAIRLQPDYPDAHYHLGAALQDEGDLDAASYEYDKALELKPDYPEAHNKLGVIELMRGRPYLADDEFRAALRIKPDFAEAHYNLGRAFEADRKLARITNTDRVYLEVAALAAAAGR